MSLNLISRYVDLIDYFIPVKVLKDPDQWYRARILSGICLSTNLVVLFFMVFVLFMLDQKNAFITLGFMVPIFFLFTGILFYYRKTGHHVVCSNFLCGITLAGVLAGIVMAGGPVKSPAGYVTVLVPLLAFCLAGKKSGLAWAVITLSCFIGLSVMHFSGYEFTNTIKEGELAANVVADWTIGYVLAVLVVFIYDQMNQRLKSERDTEKERYKSMAMMALESSVVTESANELSQSGDALLNHAVQQKTAIEELATTSEQLGATAEQNSQIASEAKVSIQDTENELNLGKLDIEKMVNAINAVKESSAEIQTINNLINDISYQTNVLSLNAMIEASRSGDSGGGFKVVATEVRKLAERSAQAAEDINHLLQQNLLSVQDGVQLSQATSDRFDSISEKMTPLSDSIQNVSAASDEQNAAIRQIMDGLNDIDASVQSNMNMAERTSKAARELQENADAMIGLFDDLDILGTKKT